MDADRGSRFQLANFANGCQNTGFLVRPGLADFQFLDRRQFPSIDRSAAGRIGVSQNHVNRHRRLFRQPDTLTGNRPACHPSGTRSCCHLMPCGGMPASRDKPATPASSSRPSRSASGADNSQASVRLGSAALTQELHRTCLSAAFRESAEAFAREALCRRVTAARAR